jgi:hypothetical protein
MRTPGFPWQDLDSTHWLEKIPGARRLTQEETDAIREAMTPTGCDHYLRPKGVMGGPCINCGAPQPYHVGIRREEGRKMELKRIKEQLQIMICSAEVYVDADQNIIGYKIKTGALHRLIGMLELTVPIGLPIVGSSNDGEVK